MRVLFIYYAPHPIHAAFAETVTGEWYGCGVKYSEIIKNLIRSLFSRKRDDYDVLFLESGTCIPAAVLKKGRNTKVVLLNADPLFYDMPKINYIKRKIIEHLLSYVDVLIVNSELNRSLASKYFDRDIYKVYPFGVNSNFDLECDLESNKVLFIGNEGNYKGYNSLLKAIKKLNKNGNMYDLYMVGSSSDKIKENHEWLHKEGFQYNKLNQYFEKCSIYVHPAEYESFGAVVLEAMSVGLIPLITKNSGASEILKDNDLEFLILDGNDADLIADKIREITNKPMAWKKQVSMKCREISAYYTRDKQLKKFKNVFDDINKQSLAR